MAYPAIAFDNKADTSIITVDNSLALAPAANLVNPHVAKKCRVNDDSMAIVFDLGSSTPVDTFMLAGVSGEDPTFRVRGASVDASGVAGDVFDSGSLTGLPYFDDAYGLFVYLRSAQSSPRYIRIDVSETGVDYVEAGRLFCGIRQNFGLDHSVPYSRTPVRLSDMEIGVGGQTFIDLKQGHWRVSAPFGFVSEAKRNGFIEEVGVLIVESGHTDFLWIKDPDSDNLSRDCLWGYFDGDPVTSQEEFIVPPVYSVTLDIRQRR